MPFEFAPREMIDMYEALGLDIDLSGCTFDEFARAVEKRVAYKGKRSGGARVRVYRALGLAPSAPWADVVAVAKAVRPHV